MNLNVQFNTQSFIREIDRLSRLTGMTMQSVMYTQMSLWAKWLSSYTYPRKKEHGERAVEKDLGYIFRKVPDQKWKNDKNFFESAAESGLPSSTFIWKSERTGSVYGVENDYVLNSWDEIVKAHAKNRLKNGRVTRAGTKTRNIGRWKFVDKYHVKASLMRQYIDQQQGHVGREKAGWVRSAQYFMTKSDKSIDRGKLAKWVTRHNLWSKANGGYSDTIKPQSISGQVSAFTSVPWAEDDGIMGLSLKVRLKDLQENMYKRWMKSAKKTGLKVAA